MLISRCFYCNTTKEDIIFKKKKLKKIKNEKKWKIFSASFLFFIFLSLKLVDLLSKLKVVMTYLDPFPVFMIWEFSQTTYINNVFLQNSKEFSFLFFTVMTKIDVVSFTMQCGDVKYISRRSLKQNGCYIYIELIVIFFKRCFHIPQTWDKHANGWSTVMSENVSPSSFEDVDLSNNTTVNNNNDDYEPIYETLTLPPIISTKKRKGTNKPERPGIVLFLFCFFLQ